MPENNNRNRARARLAFAAFCAAVCFKAVEAAIVAGIAGSNLLAASDVFIAILFGGLLAASVYAAGEP